MEYQTSLPNRSLFAMAPGISPRISFGILNFANREWTSYETCRVCILASIGTDCVGISGQGTGSLLELVIELDPFQLVDSVGSMCLTLECDEYYGTLAVPLLSCDWKKSEVQEGLWDAGAFAIVDGRLAAEKRDDEDSIGTMNSFGPCVETNERHLYSLIVASVMLCFCFFLVVKTCLQKKIRKESESFSLDSMKPKQGKSLPQNRLNKWWTESIPPPVDVLLNDPSHPGWDQWFSALYAS